MSDGDFQILDGWIDGLRGLSRDGLAEIAAEARAGVEADAKRTAGAGTDPFGVPWAARKHDGGRPMVNAADHVTVTQAGPTLRIKLRGPDVWHQFATRGEPQRKVIPDASDPVPPGARAAILAARDRVLARRLGGAP